MATIVSVSVPVFRGDSTVLPVITGSSDDVPYIKIHDWLYYPLLADGTFIPPNRTLNPVSIVLRNLFFPTCTRDTGINEVGSSFIRASGEGYQGVVMDANLDADKWSVQIEASSTSLSVGISVQDNSGTIEHTYTTNTVAHSVTLGQDGQGSIRELGVLPVQNGTFKYEVGDIVLMEGTNSIVRYYLIKPDSKMRLLRQTRSKLTEAPQAEVLLYFTGSEAVNFLVHSDDEASTSFENIGVMFDNIYWQRFGDSRSRQSIGDVLELADKSIEVTYRNSKRRLTSIGLQPKSYSKEDFAAMLEFTDWHDIDKEFIFVDFARKDLNDNPFEMWARLNSAFVDATRNGCQFDHSQAIVEDFRNDYIPPQIDTISPVVEIDDITTGSAIITGTASDNVLLKSLQLYQNGYKYGAEFLPDGSGNWTITVPTLDLVTNNAFYVIATDYGGNTTQSNTMNYVLDVEPPSVPSGFSATKFSSTRIDVAFSASTDNVAVTGYKLRRATNSGFTTGVTDIDIGNVLAYSNTGLSPSTQYWYKVLAYDAALNESAYSTADSDTTDAPPPIVLEYHLGMQSFANNDPVGTLVDSSGNAFNATNATANKPVFKNDDGDYLLFISGGGAIRYLNVPDYTAFIGTEAQLYAVLQTTAVTTKLWRMLGESNQAAAYTEVFSGNIYEPFGTTTRKDNKVPVPLFNSAWCLYHVITRNGLYDMRVNGVSVATMPTATNTFNKSTTNPFVLGYLSSGCDMKLKYLSILNDDTTDLEAALISEFSL